MQLLNIPPYTSSLRLCLNRWGASGGACSAPWGQTVGWPAWAWAGESAQVCGCVWCSDLEAVHTAQVFASNETLVLWFGLYFTWQRRAGAPETANFWNWIPTQPSFRLCQLAKQKTCESATKLMLMLAQVNVFQNSQCQTPLRHFTVHPKQVEYDDSLLRWIQVFAE